MYEYGIVRNKKGSGDLFETVGDQYRDNLGYKKLDADGRRDQRDNSVIIRYQVRNVFDGFTTG